MSKPKNTKEILEKDKLHLFCQHTQEYEPCDELLEVKDLYRGGKKVNIKIMKGVSENGKKLYNQINGDLYKELKEKFNIIK